MLLKLTPAYLLLFACALAVQGGASENPEEPLPVDAALAINSFTDNSQVQFSPDGKWLAYAVVDRTGEDRKGGIADGVTAPSLSAKSRIYLYDCRTQQTRKLPEPEGDAWRPLWSPDGRSLAFLSGSAEQRQELWLWQASNGTVRRISDAAVQGPEVAWTNDGKHLLVLLSPGSEEQVSATSKGHAKTAGSTVRLYQSDLRSSRNNALQSADPWPLNGYRRDLAVVDIVSGHLRTIVARQRISTFRLSPDGRRIAYSSPVQFEKPGSQQILFELATVDLQTGQNRVLTANVHLGFDGSQFQWSPDGEALLFREYGPHGAGDCYLVRWSSGSRRNITNLGTSRETPPDAWASTLWGHAAQGLVYFIHQEALWRAEVRGSHAQLVAHLPLHYTIRSMISCDDRFCADSSAVVVAYDRAGKQDCFFRIDLNSGRYQKLLEERECYTCVDQRTPVICTGNGQQLAYFAEDAQHPADLWLGDFQLKHRRRITDLNPQIRGYGMGTVRLIDWLSDDGERLQGTLLLPSGYQASKRYPLIVWVYGGFTLSDCFDRFGLLGPGPFNMQLLATRGYAVLLPDAPQHLGTPMLDLAKAVLPGVNRVIAMGVADPDRLGIMGHSYGGFSVLALIVQTNRFKAAVEADGYADLTAHYGEMDVSGAAFGTSVEEQGQGLMGVAPWDSPQRYLENSPLTHLDRLRTPLLIVHGGEDSTVAPFLADEIFVGLRRLGRKVLYTKYAGEGHSPIDWSYANQKDFCNRFIRWFGTFLKPTGEILLERTGQPAH